MDRAELERMYCTHVTDARLNHELALRGSDEYERRTYAQASRACLESVVGIEVVLEQDKRMARHDLEGIFATCKARAAALLDSLKSSGARR